MSVIEPQAGDAPARQQPSPAPVLIALGVLIAIVAAAMIFLVQSRNEQAAAPASGPDTSAEAESRKQFVSTMTIPAFTLHDQEGKDAGPEVFRGARTVLTFTFTHCPAVCPSMLSNLLPLYFDAEAKNLRFVSITVDPERDTPEVLKAHAEKLGVETSRWRMLTGDAAQIKSIVTSLKFALQENPAQPIDLGGGATMSNIMHPTWAVLVDSNGRVMDFFDALSREGVDQLKARALGK